MILRIEISIKIKIVLFDLMIKWDYLRMDSKTLISFLFWSYQNLYTFIKIT